MPGGPLTSKRATAATARPGPASGGATSRSMCSVPSRRFRTPSCTRIRRTASSTAPARRRNSSRRPSGSICGPSRSPTTTGSTGWCGSRRPPRNSRCRRCSVRSCHSAAATAPRIPIRQDHICWCLPAGRRAIDGCRDSWRPRIWQAARRASCATTTTR